MRNKVYSIIIIFLLLGCNSSKPSEDKSDLFISLGEKETGITFQNKLTYKTELNIIEYLYYYNGGGVAIGDLNNDGLEDIYFTGNQVPDRLYLNLGDLKFKDISLSAGISQDDTWSSGVTIEDVNNDGLLDIYVAKVSPVSSIKTSNKLYINNGDLTFDEKSASYGLDFSGFSTQSVFFDYDRDGDLDMYLLNHSIHTVRSYGTSEKRKESDPLSGDRFFENRLNENEGKFVDVTQATKIYDSPLGYGLAIVATDINDDGWLDLYIGNDFHENDYIYINNQDKTFTESIQNRLSHMSHFTMGVDVADLNHDGYLDIFTTDMMPYDSKILLKSGGEDSDKISRIKSQFGFQKQYSRNNFQLNRGDGTFSEIAFKTNTYASDWSWGVLLQDFNLDGDNDIFIANGIVKRPNDLDYINYLSNTDFTKYSNTQQDEIKKDLIDKMPELKINNILFENQGDLSFKRTFVGKPNYSTGAAYSDLDNDGDLDLVINNLNGYAELLENTSNGNNNFISISLKGNQNYPIIRGAKLWLYSNGEVFTKENTTVKGFQSASSHTINIGLGNRKELDSLIIRWPDGALQKVFKIDINQNQIINRSVKDTNSFKSPVLTNNIENGNIMVLPIEHKENIFYDYERERLIPESLSNEGPAAIEYDFNNDGYQDFFVGGAKYQSARIFLGSKEGDFSKVSNPDFELDKNFEDVDAALFDFDGDGDKDLYVVSGGGENMEMDPNLSDRIYLNQGRGNFKRIKLGLPYTNGSTVSVTDLNNDGFDDLFIGSRSIPGSYGLSPYSFILLNNQNQSFTIIDKKRYGMITDSEWVDIDNDGKQDLILVGDWMPIRILLNLGDNKFDDVTRHYGLEKSNGLWNAILPLDINKDGKIDFLAGNAGVNTKWKASLDKPVKMFLNDFDQNMQLDPIIFYDYFGNYIPFTSKDNLNKQLPYLKKKFPSYNDYSEVQNIKDLTGVDENEVIETKYIYTLKSSLFINKGNRFEAIPLHAESQLSSIEDFVVIEDSLPKIFYVGGSNNNVNELGNSLANPGGVLLNFDSFSNSFKKSKKLLLPQSLNPRKILRMDNNFFIFTNGSFIFKIDEL